MAHIASGPFRFSHIMDNVRDYLYWLLVPHYVSFKIKVSKYLLTYFKLDSKITTLVYDKFKICTILVIYSKIMVSIMEIIPRSDDLKFVGI